jgi:hypothetical protein
VPTGDENELLGTGGLQSKFLLVASSERGRFGQHLNIGYTVAKGVVAGTLAGLTAAPVPDEINYSGGVEFVANPRFTVVADVVGRTLRGAGRLDLVNKEFEYTDTIAVNDPSRPQCGLPDFICHASIFLDEFDPRSGDLNLLLGTGGVKFNPVGNLLISGSVLFPLTSAGLRSNLTTVIGVDYVF